MDEALGNGYMVVARTLARLGIRYMYGVIGIPVTELASAVQAQSQTGSPNCLPSLFL